MSKEWRDTAGNLIHKGAIVKVYHFTGARNKKYFMYKQVVEVSEKEVSFAHLPIKSTPKRDFGVRDSFKDYLVISCPCEEHIYNDLKTHKRFK